MMLSWHPCTAISASGTCTRHRGTHPFYDGNGRTGGNKHGKDLEDAMAKMVANAGLKEKEAQIVLLLLQYEAFGLFGDASVQEVASFLRVGKQQARKYISSLEEKGICRKLNSYNPVTFRLTCRIASASSESAQQRAVLRWNNVCYRVSPACIMLCRSPFRRIRSKL